MKFHPGKRVMIFDYLLFRDDITTPLSHTMRPATVVRHRGKDSGGDQHESTIDVVFDHRPDQVSRGHFTDCVRELSEVTP